MRFCLGVTVVFIVVNVGRGARAAEIRWDDCAGCHIERRDPGRVPFVNAEILGASIHARLECLDCHSDATEVEREAGAPPHKRTLEEVRCTQACHVAGNTMGAPDFSPMDQYKESAHGLARKAGRKDAAMCPDCHGRHNIKPKDDPKSNVYRANIPLTCSVCHEDMRVLVKRDVQAEKTFQEYDGSVHGRAAYNDGRIEVAAICVDCHGFHDIQPAGLPNPKPRHPETCGECHEAILLSYERSSHGIASMKEGNPDAPVCADCHGEHRISIPAEGKIPSTCSQCHAEKALAEDNYVPTSSPSAYAQSYHGIADGPNGKTVANCASCHGHHDVLAPTDRESPVHSANLVKTCGRPQCHQGISPGASLAGMHVASKKKNFGGSVRNPLAWIVGGLLAVSLILVAFTIARRLNIGSKG